MSQPNACSIYPSTWTVGEAYAARSLWGHKPFLARQWKIHGTQLFSLIYQILDTSHTFEDNIDVTLEKIETIKKKNIH